MNNNYSDNKYSEFWIHRVLNLPLTSIYPPIISFLLLSCQIFQLPILVDFSGGSTPIKSAGEQDLQTMPGCH